MVEGEIGSKGSRDPAGNVQKEGKAGVSDGENKNDSEGIKKTAIKKSVNKPIIKKSSIRLDEQMEETKMLIDPQPIPIIVKKY